MTESTELIGQCNSCGKMLHGHQAFQEHRCGENMKMYFVVKEDVPLTLAMRGIAHGAMLAEIKWGKGDYKEYNVWREKSAEAVIVRATPDQFQEAVCVCVGFFVREGGVTDTIFVAYPMASPGPGLEFLDKLPPFSQQIKDRMQKVSEVVKTNHRKVIDLSLELVVSCYNRDSSNARRELWDTYKNMPHFSGRRMKEFDAAALEGQEMLKRLTIRASEEYDRIHNNEEENEEDKTPSTTD